MGRADLLERGARREIADTRIGLDVLAGIVVERLAGLLVDALGPVDLRIGLRQDRLTVEAVEGVEEAVAGRVGDELARLPGDVAVDQDVGADLVVVPHVTGRELEIPAEHETPKPIGSEAPWRGRRMTRTSWQKYLPPNCAPTPSDCVIRSTCLSMSRSRKAWPSSEPWVGRLS